MLENLINAFNKAIKLENFKTWYEIKVLRDGEVYTLYYLTMTSTEAVRQAKKDLSGNIDVLNVGLLN